MQNYKFLLTHEELDSLELATIGAMSYKTIIGETIASRGEALYVKIIELANIVNHKSGPGYMWICINDMIYSHISHLVKESSEELFQYGSKEIRFMGIIDRKIKVFVNPKQDAKIEEPNTIYMGNTFDNTVSGVHFCKLNIFDMAI